MIDLPENVLDLSASRRVWNGVSVDVTEWRGSGMVAHQFPYETETRLITLLEEVGSPCEPWLRENQPCRIGYTPRHMDFAPAGMELWGYSADVRFVKDATLTFDFGALGERLATQFDRDAISNAEAALFRRSHLDAGQASSSASRRRPANACLTIWSRTTAI